MSRGDLLAVSNPLDIIRALVRQFGISDGDGRGTDEWEIGQKVTVRNRSRRSVGETAYFLARFWGEIEDDPRPLGLAVCDALGLASGYVRIWKPCVRDDRAVVLLGNGQVSPVKWSSLRETTRGISSIEEIVRTYRVRESHWGERNTAFSMWRR